MATKKGQRIGIWIIAGALVLGTLGGFIAMVLAPKNQAADQARIQQAMNEYQKQMTDYQAKVTAQTDELSAKYFETFNAYAATPAAFDAASVTAVTTNDLKVGDGAEVKAGESQMMYYIGWNPSGKVFDQSIDTGKLKAPISTASVIPGMTEGIAGMKIGGVREISIPADKAYGEQGSGADIPPNTPIKFIVMLIPQPSEQLVQPQPSPELIQLYGQQQQ